ncbi:antibiotic biosynthesis monooxygenase [Bacillus sp. AK031]
MILVTNNIKIKKGKAYEVAERFKKRKGIEETPGFVKMQLLISTDQEEHDVLHVSTTWENEEAFKAWTQSNAFKEAHSKRNEEGSSQEKGESPILGAYLTKSEIVYEHE